jgi:hypothetical protein
MPTMTHLVKNNPNEVSSKQIQIMEIIIAYHLQFIEKSNLRNLTFKIFTEMKAKKNRKQFFKWIEKRLF